MFRKAQHKGRDSCLDRRSRIITWLSQSMDIECLRVGRVIKVKAVTKHGKVNYIDSIICEVPLN